MTVKTIFIQIIKSDIKSKTNQSRCYALIIFLILRNEIVNFYFYLKRFNYHKYFNKEISTKKYYL